MNQNKDEEELYADHKFFGVIYQQAKKLNEYLRDLITDIMCLLNSTKIDLKKLRKLTIVNTLEKSQSLRSLCWKIYFNYLPTNSRNWEAYIDNKRNEYNEIKYMALFKHNKKTSHKKDHPLSQDSNWQDYFKENKLGDIIEKDLKRTRNEITFFDGFDSNKEKHMEVLKRILIIMAKKHPEINYVQGLNELLALIYYCFAHDTNPYFYLDLEADTFYCFENLILTIGDLFIQDKDFTETGIKSRINYIHYLLELIDYEVYANLYHMKVDITLPVFRWFSLFFTQDFSIKGSMTIMDFVLSNDDIFYSLTLLCLAALKIKRQVLLSKDYANIMNSLQSFEEDDILLLIAKTAEVERDILNDHNKLDYITFVNSNKNVRY